MASEETSPAYVLGESLNFLFPTSRMQGLLSLLLLTSAISLGMAASTSCNCGWVNSGRIVGGHEAPKNKYPMIVTLETLSGRQFCGGTIITPWHVLTAAHCTAKVRSIQVRAGAHNKRYSGVVYKIASIIDHEKYNDKTGQYDISLLLTTTKMAFNLFIGPACLPNKRVSIAKQKVTALGWGNTRDKGPDSDVLLEVQLSVMSFNKCQDLWYVKSPQESMHLCTYEIGKDTCQGDSGGPLLWLDPETKRFTLVALVSYGGPCAGPKPGINTDVSAFLDWIKSKISATKSGVSACSKT